METRHEPSRYQMTNADARTERLVSSMLERHNRQQFAKLSKRRLRHSLPDVGEVWVDQLRCCKCGSPLLPVDRCGDAGPLIVWPQPGWKRWKGNYNTGLVIRRVNGARGQDESDLVDETWRGWQPPLTIVCPAEGCGFPQRVVEERLGSVRPFRRKGPEN